MKTRNRISLIICISFITITTLLKLLLSTNTPLRSLHSPHLPPFTNATTTPTSHLQHVIPDTPICSFITPPSGEWSYNSRSFCRFPRACITDVLHLPTIKPTCQNLTSALIPHNSPQSCSSQQLNRITCAYSHGQIRNSPTCTQPHPLSHDQYPSLNHAVFIPQYPFPANIYHYANVITTLTHILTLHRFNPSINLVFLSKPNINPWQQSFKQVLLNHLRPLYPHLNVLYHYPFQTLCAENVLLLGRRGHVNVWPFPNTTVITPYAKQIPLHSISFRNAFYTAYQIKRALPTKTHLTVATPPLVLGYARRLGPSDPTAGNVHQIGTLRRFSHQDEIWFQSLLHNQTNHFGVTLRIFTTSPQDSLRDQVSNFASLGGVIGIHGANLVNCIFMPPLSVLIEVFPANVTSKCYYAGSNSGLRYIRFDSHHPATPEESGCTSGRCMMLSRQRRVKIERAVERERLTNAVRDGLEYLVNLHRKYPSGVPITEDTRHAMYNLVE